MIERSFAHQALLAVVFGLIGIFLLLAGFKMFDWITPRMDVEKELAEHHNIAVAIVVAAVFIAVAIIVHAAVAG